jgi:hypothetical protein
MKSTVKMTLSTFGLAILGPVAVLAFQEVERGGRPRNAFTVDVAADCRTFVNGPNRADVSYGSGKIFPAGTLPSGTAANDPIQPVNGIAPIGDWTTRGQIAFPFPPAVADSYSSTPTFFANQYYLLDDGRTALTVDGYAYFQGGTPVRAEFAVTGGIGHFRGATGDTAGTTLGTNVTGCPNFRLQFNFVPGSIRDAAEH